MMIMSAASTRKSSVRHPLMLTNALLHALDNALDGCGCEPLARKQPYAHRCVRRFVLSTLFLAAVLDATKLADAVVLDLVARPS